MRFSAVIFGGGHPLDSAAAALFFSIVGAMGIRAARPRRAQSLHRGAAAPSPEEVDASWRELSAKGVPFQAPPADYPWNAYYCYFSGPDDEILELYAWREGGGPGDVE